MRQLRRLVMPATLALALIGSAPRPAPACPNCKEAVASQGNGQSLQQGYFYSILFMMGMPFALLGTGAFFVTRAIKRGGLPEF